jgi:hypothetical protein
VDDAVAADGDTLPRRLDELDESLDDTITSQTTPPDTKDAPTKHRPERREAE